MFTYLRLYQLPETQRRDIVFSQYGLNVWLTEKSYNYKSVFLTYIWKIPIVKCFSIL